MISIKVVINVLLMLPIQVAASREWTCKMCVYACPDTSNFFATTAVINHSKLANEVNVTIVDH